MLRRSAEDAVTDGLSGLGNRRRLMRDLEEAVAVANEHHPRTLVFFDLNGFKRYNDTFGHAAGDALLARLGASLRDAVGGHGEAYRLGGDEFCLLLNGRVARDDALIEAATTALDRGGQHVQRQRLARLAAIPDEAATTTAALQLADQRMYADKIRTSRSTAAAHARGAHAGAQRAQPGSARPRPRRGAARPRPRRRLRPRWRPARRAAARGRAARHGQAGASPTRSSTSRALSTTTSGASCASTPPSASGSSTPTLCSSRWRAWSGQPRALGRRRVPRRARRRLHPSGSADHRRLRCLRRHDVRPLLPTARTLPDALAELRRCAGTQFDPEVIAALCSRLERSASRDGESAQRAGDPAVLAHGLDPVLTGLAAEPAVHGHAEV